MTQPIESGDQSGVGAGDPSGSGDRSVSGNRFVSVSRAQPESLSGNRSRSGAQPESGDHSEFRDQPPAGAEPVDRHARSARSFDGAAEIYDASRPDYPAEAVAWILPEGTRRVLDLGAGTGKLTTALIDRGLDVVAVDPSPQMLEVLARRAPGARPVMAGAENLPLDDASVDVVTVAQAWHWVDPIAASAEAARVLVPGGTLSLVWNIRDESVEWIRRFGEIAGSERSFRDLGEDPVVGAEFGAFERAEFPWSRSMTREQVLDLVRSRSWFLTADEERRREMIRDISRLVDDASIDGTVQMAYVTEVFRTRTAH